MAVPVIMPRQGQSVESCVISKWHKQKGDEVNEGDVLFSFETDKASFDEESKTEGTLLEVFFDEGEDVPVLTNVCVIGQIGESIERFLPEAKRQESVDAVPADDGKIKISPRAKTLAERSCIDIRYAVGTGPDGRIIEEDIINLKSNGPIFTFAAKERSVSEAISHLPDGTGMGGRITVHDLTGSSHVQESENSGANTRAGYTEVKLTNIRKTIAKAMHDSLSSSAQLTINMSFDVTNMLNYRKRLKSGKEKDSLDVTLNDMMLYAVSRALEKHRELNAYFLDDRMLLLNNVHLGVAVDTDRGLFVPTIFNANEKTLYEISAEIKLLAGECRKGTVNPDSLKGGSFTVTNLGSLGVESFTPVLNPPQTGILGVNTIEYKIRKEGEEYINYPSMNLSLTFDHRAVDGAPAARFLRDLKDSLENFSIIFANNVQGGANN